MSIDHDLADIIQEHQVRLTIRSSPVEAPGLGWMISATPLHGPEAWRISASARTLAGAVQRLRREMARLVDHPASRKG